MGRPRVIKQNAIYHAWFGYWVISVITRSRQSDR
jgi:hypothetical protein